MASKATRASHEPGAHPLPWERVGELAASAAEYATLKSKVTPIEVTPRVFYSKRWLEKIDHLLRLKPRLMVTGHGAVSRDPARDLALTRDYLVFLREAMGKAVEDFMPFDEAYAATDWSRFARVPAFEAANRINAYGQYLVMERELLKK